MRLPVARMAMAAAAAAFLVLAAVVPRSDCAGINDADYELTVLHVNDIHVRLEETNVYTGNCRESEKASGHCFGGVARMLTAVDEAKRTQPNVIFLNGGDFYQGNIWYTHFKWRVVAHFANILNFTAMSPGNHEFDDKVPGFVPFLKNVTFPVVAANMDASEEPTLQGLFAPSTTVTVGGRKIGIIGYVTTDTKEISSPEDTIFIDEVVGIQQEAKKLKAAGVDILIALGHSGYKKDQEIAREVEEIDLVVGGHSHSFLYSGQESPSVEKPEGPYPTLVKQPTTGRTVPVVQAYAFTKYLGYFKIWFDDQGEMTGWEGEPMLLDNQIKQDEYVLEELKPWRSQIESYVNQVLGETKVLLLKKRGSESNLGNFVADSMVEWYAQTTATSTSWTSASVALMNSGGLRGSLEMGQITKGDLLTVMPFRNTVDMVSMKGKYLKQMLEKAVAGHSRQGKTAAGAFLQVAGLRYIADVRRPSFDRIHDLRVRCSNCKVPKYSPLDPDETYNVILNSYIANGADGYRNITSHKTNHIKGPLDTDVFIAHLNRRSPVTQGIESRIRMLTEGHVDYAYEYNAAKSGGSQRYALAHMHMLIAAIFIYLCC